MPDLAILGAGAAGLLAAARAAGRGRRTVLLEKNTRPGLKILISGGTRCNLTHDCGAAGIVEAFGANGKFLRPALAALPPAALRKLFVDEGVPLTVETETGKVFPASQRAQDVLAALLRMVEKSGARLVTGEPVVRLSAGFRIETPRQVVDVPKLILATGGLSYPSTGTTGDGFRFAAALGHTIVPPRAALTPLASGEAWVRALAGIAIQDAEVRVVERGNPKALDRRRAAVLFTHFGISGPAAMDVSRTVSGHALPAALALEIDLLPATPAPALDAWLRAEAAAGGKRQVVTVLAERVPRRLADAVVAGLPPERKLSELSKAERAAVVTALKGLRVPLTGTLGFAKAEVTAGGVALDEVNPKTMESRIVPGLFFAGEVLDLDGWIGGYNFQSAFSTGWLAGSSV